MVILEKSEELCIRTFLVLFTGMVVGLSASRTRETYFSNIAIWESVISESLTRARKPATDDNEQEEDDIGAKEKKMNGFENYAKMAKKLTDGCAKIRLYIRETLAAYEIMDDSRLLQFEVKGDKIFHIKRTWAMRDVGEDSESANVILDPGPDDDGQCDICTANNGICRYHATKINQKMLNLNWMEDKRDELSRGWEAVKQAWAEDTAVGQGGSLV
jgi:hypothetical protein